MTIRTDIAFALEMDAQDELARFRDRFVSDDPELIYMDGNSLGRLPKATIERMQEVVEGEWGRRLIRGNSPLDGSSGLTSIYSRDRFLTA